MTSAARDHWTELDCLLREFGDAVYVLDVARFRGNVDALRLALAPRWPRTRLGYSYKTNPQPRLCREAFTLGLYAEVVSGTEYAMAIAFGVPIPQVIFNGPIKTDAELHSAFAGGAVVNVDSLSEAQQICAILRRSDLGPVRIGLRCNLDLRWKDRESRFGLSESSGELAAAAELLGGLPGVRIAGLHCHTSFDRSPESYARRMRRLIELADRHLPTEPEFLDVGGGICGPMPPDLAEQLSTPAASYADYAEAITQPLRDRYPDGGPELILEPGVGLVGDVFSYVCRVAHLKRVGSRTVAVTSGAAHNLKIVPNAINPPTVVVPSPYSTAGDRAVGADLVGYTCLEHDVLVRECPVPVAQGDILVLGSSGAYSMVYSADFIRATPAVVECTPNGTWIVCRRRRNVEELLQIYDEYPRL